MTAHAMPEDRDRCLRAGMDAYMSPSRLGDLEREVGRLEHDLVSLSQDDGAA